MTYLRGFALTFCSCCLALALVAALGWLLGHAMDNPAAWALREVR